MSYKAIIPFSSVSFANIARLQSNNIFKRLNILYSTVTQTLSEKIQELDKLRNEWASHTATLSNKHSQELTNEKEKALQV